MKTLADAVDWLRGEMASGSASETEARPGGTTVVLVGPAYDALTIVMRKWVERLDVGAKRRLIAENASRSELMRFVSDMGPRDRLVVIFYGHGSEGALLTAPELGDTLVQSSHSELFRAVDSPPHASIVVIAYCCHAGRVLGPAIRQRREENRFLGFGDELPFLFGTAEREGAFEAPMRNYVEAALKSGGGSLDPEALRSEYKRQHEMWGPAGTLGADSRAMMVQILLEEHMELIQSGQED